MARDANQPIFPSIRTVHKSLSDRQYLVRVDYQRGVFTGARKLFKVHDVRSFILIASGLA